MRRILYLAMLVLVGCQNLVGPRERRANPSRVDAPGLTISDQKRQGRDKLAIPEMSKAMVPRDYSDFTGPYNP